MAQTVTLEFDGPPCQRHDFPLYGGKLDMGRVEAEFGLQRVHVNNLPLGIDPQGLSREEFQPGAVIKITGTMAAGIGSGGVFGGSGGTNVEPFLVTFKKNKKAAEVPFDGIPSWQDLCKAAEKKFLELKAEDFCLKAGKTHLSERMWPGFAAKKASLTIGVISLCKPFSSFQQEEAYSMLGVEEEHAEIDNKAFPLVQYKADAPLTAALQACLGFAKWGDLVAHTGKELALRCCLSNPKQHTKEASKRELISPVIFAAAALIGDVQPGPDDLQLVAGVTVEAEYNVRGTLGRGSVDYVVLHKHFSIVVVEGKLHETLEEHLGQLAAEIRATREQYTRVYHKKRKYEDEGEFKKVPSFGILTNGSRYILYKYNAENKTLVRRELDTSLAQGISAEAAGQAVLPIIRCLMHVIQQQVESMINMPATKKGRTE